MAMELRVFETLDWLLNSVKPTDYLVRLLSLMNCSNTKTLERSRSLPYRNIDWFTGIKFLPRFLSNPVLKFAVPWSHNPSISLGIRQEYSILPQDFLYLTVNMFQAKNYENIHSIKKMIQSCLILEYTIEGLPPDSVEAVIANVYPFVLLRNANLLDPFAIDTFITTILPSKKTRKRK